MPYLTELSCLSVGKELFFTDRFFLWRITNLIQFRDRRSADSRYRASVYGYPKKYFDPKTCAEGKKSSSSLVPQLMIFGLSNYLPAQSMLKRRSHKQDTSSTGTSSTELMEARIFDIEHQRKLKALHTLVEKGTTLSEAARLIGVSRICAHRWNDYGRR